MFDKSKELVQFGCEQILKSLILRVCSDNIIQVRFRCNYEHVRTDSLSK